MKDRPTSWGRMIAQQIVLYEDDQGTWQVADAEAAGWRLGEPAARAVGTDVADVRGEVAATGPGAIEDRLVDVRRQDRMGRVGANSWSRVASEYGSAPIEQPALLMRNADPLLKRSGRIRCSRAEKRSSNVPWMS
jgi:hypothetical protein